MIFGQDRSELRKMYADAWRKFSNTEILSPLEGQIAQVIEEHPEYQAAVADIETGSESEYAPEDGQVNPFLHMGLHLAIREQVATNRPAGIAGLYQAMAVKTGDPHQAEHRMFDCLAETMWDAQRNNKLPDEQLYMERLRQII